MQQLGYRVTPLIIGLLVSLGLSSCDYIAPRSGGVSNFDPVPVETPKAGSKVTLRVMTPSGKPVAGAIVDIYSPGETNPAVGMVTDMQGQFSWTLMPDTYIISAHALEYESETTRIEVIDNRPVTVTLTLVRK